jgi:hypothetical protein
MIPSQMFANDGLRITDYATRGAVLPDNANDQKNAASSTKTDYGLRGAAIRSPRQRRDQKNAHSTQKD